VTGLTEEICASSRAFVSSHPRFRAAWANGERIVLQRFAFVEQVPTQYLNFLLSRYPEVPKSFI